MDSIIIIIIKYTIVKLHKQPLWKSFHALYKPDNDLLMLKYVAILQKIGYCFYNNKVVLEYSNYILLIIKHNRTFSMNINSVLLGKVSGDYI
jgi:hypothetical protein